MLGVNEFIKGMFFVSIKVNKINKKSVVDCFIVIVFFVKWYVFILFVNVLKGKWNG